MPRCPLSDGALANRVGCTLDVPQADDVSLHHLLTHTSGLRSFTNELDFLNRPPPENDAEMIAVMAKQGYMFSPGERFDYSNSGYVLLGMVVARTSGKSLRDYMHEKFFLPLGMTHTGLLDAVKLASKENVFGLVGYSQSFWPAGRAFLMGSPYTVCDFSENIDASLLLWAAGAGAMYSTARDLVAWNDALFGSDLTDGTVLSAASLKQALTAAVSIGGISHTWYGYGFMLDQSEDDLGNFGSRSISRISHSGGLPGFTARLFYLPSERISIAVLSNTLAGQRGATFIGAEFESIWTRQMLSGVHEEHAVDAKISDEQRSKFIGKYDFSADGWDMLTISQDKATGRLTARGDMVATCTLVAITPTKVVSTKIHPVISFELTSQGDGGEETSVLVARLASAGRKAITGRRILEKEMCSYHATSWFTRGDRETLSRCAGLFDYGHGGMLIRPGRFRGVLVASLKKFANPFPGANLFPFSIALYHLEGGRFCVSGLEPMVTVEFAFGGDQNGGHLTSATHMTICMPGELPRIIGRIEKVKRLDLS
jgi:CubicO group peptidase (beta-lactamase class C family)